ncbi:relaxase/mobilization nuclease domain-containing protein [Phenylobacterium sp.]|uniref:relaxase/mobilization nuclease domain-containing protein n=1 Tax=Phenylobacterium sp. TaxID=1871053 RepID=UPI003BA91EE4
MTDFQTVRGFEDVWRPAVRPRRVRPEAVLGAAVARSAVRARLVRIVQRAPEVMVKVTGRTRDPGHLAAHLSYITRNGDLAAEGRDGWLIDGRRDVLDLAADWSAASAMDRRRRSNSPESLSIILSMPEGTDAMALTGAARAFAAETFAERFDYLFVLHTDVGHPHVHLTVRALGEDGSRLSPKKGDLAAWRQDFARALRERGIAAEATPRRARGITRKPERTAVRKLRERAERAQATLPRVRRGAYQAAAKAVFGAAVDAEPWEVATMRRRATVRAVYLAQARLLSTSPDADDRALGVQVEAFIRSWPAPDTQRLALARELRRAAADRARPPDGRTRER